jgi:hypothetical protein
LNNIAQNQMKLVIYKPKIDTFVVSAKALKRLLQSIILLILLASYPAQVKAQVTQPVNKAVPNPQNRLDQLKFPRNGAPVGRRQGGARRTGTQCPDLKTPMTALVPGEGTSDESISFSALQCLSIQRFGFMCHSYPAMFAESQEKNEYTRVPMQT